MHKADTGPVRAGSVFKFENNPHAKFRVLYLGEGRVYYEAWLDDGVSSRWQSSRHRRFVYYRIGFREFQELCRLLDFEALSDAEVERVQPNMPASVCVSRHLSWGCSDSAGFEEFIEMATGLAVDLDLDETVADVGVAIQVMDSDGRRVGAPTFCHPAEGNGVLSAGRLLWHAMKLQPCLPDEGGVGLHRDGFKGRSPTYYCWGADDLLGAKHHPGQPPASTKHEHRGHPCHPLK